jgi:hypothetical protein
MDDLCDNQIADPEKHRWRLEPCPVNVFATLVDGAAGLFQLVLLSSLMVGPWLFMQE